MKRLLRKTSNHVSPKMHEEVIHDVVDGERTMRIISSDSFLTAKELVMECEITPTNENILSIMKNIDSAKYSDIGSYKENKEQWKDRTRKLFKEQTILLSNKIKRQGRSRN